MCVPQHDGLKWNNRSLENRRDDDKFRWGKFPHKICDPHKFYRMGTCPPDKFWKCRWLGVVYVMCLSEIWVSRWILADTQWPHISHLLNTQWDRNLCVLLEISLHCISTKCGFDQFFSTRYETTGLSILMFLFHIHRSVYYIFIANYNATD